MSTFHLNLRNNNIFIYETGFCKMKIGIIKFHSYPSLSFTQYVKMFIKVYWYIFIHNSRYLNLAIIYCWIKKTVVPNELVAVIISLSKNCIRLAALIILYKMAACRRVPIQLKHQQFKPVGNIEY